MRTVFSVSSACTMTATLVMHTWFVFRHSCLCHWRLLGVAIAGNQIGSSLSVRNNIRRGEAVIKSPLSFLPCRSYTERIRAPGWVGKTFSLQQSDCWATGSWCEQLHKHKTLTSRFCSRQVVLYIVFTGRSFVCLALALQSHFPFTWTLASNTRLYLHEEENSR